MKWPSRCPLADIVGGMLGVLLLVPNVWAWGPHVHKYRHSEIDMPVSLAVGTVRTPEFPVILEAYDIMLQAEKRLPFGDMRCMMGLKDGTLDFKDCKKEPLIKADWKVWDNGRVVSQGSTSGFGGAQYTNKYLFKFLGSFGGEAGKKYVVEMIFTKDGSPLNVSNPHLIVIQHRYN